MEAMSVNSTTNATTEVPYDSEGAMKFTIAVVTIYSAGMVGVLITGFVNGKKHSDTMDKQVNYYMKDIEKVRCKMEKKERLNSVSKMLNTMDFETKQKNTGVVGTGLLPFLALPVFFGQSSKEESETALIPTDSGGEIVQNHVTDNQNDVKFYFEGENKQDISYSSHHDVCHSNVNCESNIIHENCSENSNIPKPKVDGQPNAEENCKEKNNPLQKEETEEIVDRIDECDLLLTPSKSGNVFIV